jgi:DNA repair protein RecO (recombination protein O)
MHWTDSGIIVHVKKHGERSSVISLLTRQFGRQAGLVRSAERRDKGGAHQIGDLVTVCWRARLAEQLGVATCELDVPMAALLFGQTSRLLALSAACAICSSAIPDREPVPHLFDGLWSFLVRLREEHNETAWLSAYVRWELHLLAGLGYGLDLERCAVTGQRDELYYVSPTSGRAVSRTAGAPYHGRLLPLPDFLFGRKSRDDPEEIMDGLSLTGFFLQKRVYEPHGKRLPAARVRFAQHLFDTHTRILQQFQN